MARKDLPGLIPAGTATSNSFPPGVLPLITWPGSAPFGTVTDTRAASRFGLSPTEEASGTVTAKDLPTFASLGTSTSTSASSPAAPDAGLKAEVVSIGAQNAFVVLNVGSASGVQAGQRFAITRNGNAVAEALVSSVRENFAIAQIATGSLRGGLNKGDNATIAQ